MFGFSEPLRSVLAGEPSVSIRRIARRANVYACGSRDDRIYVIAAGQVKILTLSPAGKECLLAIYTAGDFFGESCLAGGPRMETATAMTATDLFQMPCTRFLARLLETGAAADFVRCLAGRLAEQQRIITNLATVDSEYRLGAVLLQLSRKLVSREARGIRGLEPKISQQELSQMVGTTRPRISEFMQRFQQLGLIEVDSNSYIVVKERYLSEYLERRMSAAAS